MEEKKYKILRAEIMAKIFVQLMAPDENRIDICDGEELLRIAASFTDGILEKCGLKERTDRP